MSSRKPNRKKGSSMNENKAQQSAPESTTNQANEPPPAPESPAPESSSARPKAKRRPEAAREL
jgi:hypothetical protein